MMKKGYFIVFGILIVTTISSVGCGKKTNDAKSSDTGLSTQVSSQGSTQGLSQGSTQVAAQIVTQTTTQVSPWLTTQAETKVSIPPTIYITSISNSAKTVHYSLTKDFEISKDALQFVSDCKFYNNIDQEISFAEFSTTVYNSNRQKIAVKSNIVTRSDNNNLIIEAHIAE